ncbi:hypothetical protein AK86_07795 [Streptococcus pneumoniae B1599]|nr:hypothetical protein AK86_07795 [Streptococcus pneumoniae B1599]
MFEKDKGDAVSQEISVEVTVKADTPDAVAASYKQNGGCRLNPTNQCGQSDHHVYQPSWSTTDREIV